VTTKKTRVITVKKKYQPATYAHDQNENSKQTHNKRKKNK
jgi:hypothetical protein